MSWGNGSCLNHVAASTSIQCALDALGVRHYTAIFVHVAKWSMHMHMYTHTCEHARLKPLADLLIEIVFTIPHCARCYAPLLLRKFAKDVWSVTKQLQRAHHHGHDYLWHAYGLITASCQWKYIQRKYITLLSVAVFACVDAMSVGTYVRGAGLGVETAARDASHDQR